LQERALRELYSSEIMEWYRVQYNIPLPVFYKTPVEEDVAHIDFYRRQYWNEVRWGIRNWGDDSLDLKMAPFTYFQPYGGVLPPPNGFGIETEYTVKNEKYQFTKDASEDIKPVESVPYEYDKEYTVKSNSNIPMHVTEATRQLESSRVESTTTSYGINNEEYWEMIDKLQNDDSLWDTIETLE